MKIKALLRPHDVVIPERLSFFMRYRVVFLMRWIGLVLMGGIGLSLESGGYLVDLLVDTVVDVGEP